MPERTEGVVYVVGHRNPDADSICSAIAYAHLKNRLGEPNVQPARAGELDAETEFVLRRFGAAPPALLEDATGQALILVDHNEVAQALPNIQRANVLEVWEHHRMGDLHVPEPILFHCEPVGATATLIAELYFARGVAPTPADAGLMLASIVSDTVAFRSPTTTDKDRAVASRLAQLAEVDPAALGEEMLRVKATATERKPSARLVRDDFKSFELDGCQVGIAQVEVSDAGALSERRPEILREMRRLREEEDLAEVILMITDTTTKSSDLWFVGERRDLVERAFGPLEGDTVHVPGCMSRKKQVLPRLEVAFMQAGDSETRRPRARRATSARGVMR